MTQPDLPPLEEFVGYLRRIWDSRTLTNNGPIHQEFEAALAKYLGVSHIVLFNNGTNALMAALRALDVQGEVITTPYSFVATAHAILWNHLTPVFADIDATTFNIDPARVEELVTERTTAILPVHCYGIPCDMAAIEAIADRHNLRVVYDAAHAFGVRTRNESVLSFGDLSVLSFHATKVFHTFEGGAVVCRDAAMKQRLDRLKNFGFVSEVEIESLGINGKMSEVQAAMGLLQLQYVDAAIARRRRIAKFYREALAGVSGITCPPATPDAVLNCSYFPILVGPEYGETRDELYLRLRQNGIYSRRYFYPLLSTLPVYRESPSAAPGRLPNSSRIAERVLCLPIYARLSDEDVERVLSVVAGRHEAGVRGRVAASSGS